ncbi:C-C chemokine receptor type 3-like [Heterodontus francisci]|uniref:C-C chemokine receptor type 3-like n=1 Tax=Heterodontus francisci TaxID=7792 RepID=UPI00355BEE94
MVHNSQMKPSKISQKCVGLPMLQVHQGDWIVLPFYIHPILLCINCKHLKVPQKTAEIQNSKVTNLALPTWWKTGRRVFPLRQKEGIFLKRDNSNPAHFEETSGIMFLTLMTIDRYLAVVHAISAARSRKVRYATITSVIVWLTSTLATAPDFIFADSIDDYDLGLTCDNIYPADKAVPWKLLRYYQQNILFFILPFIIIVYCYFRIIQTLIKCRTVQKHRTLRVIFAIVVVFFLCWAPYNVVIFLRSLEELKVLEFQDCDLEMQLDYAETISHTVAYFHCCLNPIFYAFVGEKFRRHLIHFCEHCLPCGLTCHQQQNVTRNPNLECSNGSMGNDTTNNW